MMQRLVSRFGLAFILLLSVGVSYAADVIHEARALLQSGQSAQAYALLAPLEESRAGDPEYDYLLGISALDSGKPGLAAFRK